MYAHRFALFFSNSLAAIVSSLWKISQVYESLQNLESKEAMVGQDLQAYSFSIDVNCEAST